MRIPLLCLVLTFVAASTGFASISGTVINSDGLPIAGAQGSMLAPETIDRRPARLTATTPEPPPLVAKQTDSKGNFTFDSAKEAVVDLRIEAAGFGPDALRV